MRTSTEASSSKRPGGWSRSPSPPETKPSRLSSARRSRSTAPTTRGTSRRGSVVAGGVAGGAAVVDCPSGVAIARPEDGQCALVRGASGHLPHIDLSFSFARSGANHSASDLLQ
jgi:hypothetical protein